MPGLVDAAAEYRRRAFDALMAFRKKDKVKDLMDIPASIVLVKDRALAKLSRQPPSLEWPIKTSSFGHKVETAGLSIGEVRYVLNGWLEEFRKLAVLKPVYKGEVVDDPKRAHVSSRTARCYCEKQGKETVKVDDMSVSLNRPGYDADEYRYDVCYLDLLNALRDSLMFIERGIAFLESLMQAHEAISDDSLAILADLVASKGRGGELFTLLEVLPKKAAFSHKMLRVNFAIAIARHQIRFRKMGGAVGPRSKKPPAASKPRSKKPPAAAKPLSRKQPSAPTAAAAKPRSKKPTAAAKPRSRRQPAASEPGKRASKTIRA